MKDLEKWYRVLDLQPGATIEEVNQAYKDLAFIWHPDRIPKDNIRLQQKAQDKLKEINEARDRLRSSQPQRVTATPQNSHYPQHQYYKHHTPQSEPHYSHHHQNYKHHTPPQNPPHQHSNNKHDLDLSGRDFSGANLSEKDLSSRNLSHANLSNANLKDTFLHKTILAGANLFKANLFRANLLQADLRDANLREANLVGADFSGADLRGADLRGANIGSGNRILVKFIGAKLSGAIMPDGTIHD